MPPKKKKAEEQKKKIVDDKTFGLKNKKKSKKVQQYVDTVKKQASQKVDGTKRRNAAGAASSSAASSARMAQMAARLAELELMNQPVKGAAKNMSAEEEERKRREEEEERERIRIANLPVEDQIEEERVKLTTRTPVTLERFVMWKEEKNKEMREIKEAENAAAFKKLSKAERNRLQGFTGRELFQSNAEIFVDDENALDEQFKPQNDYTADEEDDTTDAKNDQATDDISNAAPADESLFGGDESTDPPPEAQEKAVTVGDASLFS